MDMQEMMLRALGVKATKRAVKRKFAYATYGVAQHKTGPVPVKYERRIDYSRYSGKELRKIRATPRNLKGEVRR